MRQTLHYVPVEASIASPANSFLHPLERIQELMPLWKHGKDSLHGKGFFWESFCHGLPAAISRKARRDAAFGFLPALPGQAAPTSPMRTLRFQVVSQLVPGSTEECWRRDWNRSVRLQSPQWPCWSFLSEQAQGSGGQIRSPPHPCGPGLKQNHPQACWFSLALRMPCCTPHCRGSVRVSGNGDHLVF